MYSRSVAGATVYGYTNLLATPLSHPAVVGWIEQVAADKLLLSAVTVGEIEAGIELTREQDIAKAEELEAWLSAVLVSYSVLPMNADTFREWARIKHRRSDTLLEDAMIAATALVHRLTVVTRNVRDYGGDLLDGELGAVMDGPVIHVKPRPVFVPFQE